MNDKLSDADIESYLKTRIASKAREESQGAEDIVCLNLTRKRLEVYRPGGEYVGFNLVNETDKPQAVPKVDLLDEFSALNVRDRGAFFRKALEIAFKWETSKRGFAYWNSVAHAFEDIAAGRDGGLQVVVFKVKTGASVILPPPVPPLPRPENGGRYDGGSQL